MVHTLVDLTLIGLLVFSAWRGWQRGGIIIGLDLAAYLLAGFLGFVFYSSIGRLLVASFHTTPTFANAAAFGLVFALVQICYAVAASILLRRFPHRTLTSSVNRSIGLVANGIKYVLIVTVLLIVYSGLPISSAQKSLVTDARIPTIILTATSSLQQKYNSTIGSKLAATINFLTVKQDEEHLDLGFTTSNVVVRPSLEGQMLTLVNQERTSRGLNALTMNEKARVVARNYSIEMFAHGYFSHIDAQGHSPFDRMQAGGVDFGAAGENLALAPTLNQAHVGLMNSPGHRANILSPDYKTVGIGIVDGGPYGLMITQDFTD